ncbi:MAG TPA: glutamine-hydrolyzing carbamoyl-phosphate synthase small subunit [Dehalococcoidia bacterium]|nr:glutamine-hydrolyzing carbamoyl-phosphate synthase small subunit [Dehalococcoidia bacterium]
MGRALLVLEDGTVFHGDAIGAPVRSHGEVVFCTAMTGYQEALTDPSFAEQILVMTYPLQGNYGINEFDVESRRIQVRAFVVREDCERPSHWKAKRTLHEYLAENEIPGIAGVDTRALTRKLRMGGVMMGTVTHDETPEQALGRLRDLPRYGSTDLVPWVSTRQPYDYPPDGPRPSGHRIVVLDLGVKFNILRVLHRLGCAPTVVPARASAADILALNPDGVLLSPGPGDPALLDYAVEAARGLVGKTPIMGICLGHQVMGEVFGARTYKLKFGHRGANHPVRDEATGRVYVTAQNHGYAVDDAGLPPEVEVSHRNVNDGTVEGLRHRTEPVMTIQYHAEASPGPHDSMYLFERFIEMVEQSKAAVRRSD